MDPNPSPETPLPAPPARRRSPPAITPEEVVKIGQRLYGRRAWMPRMAEALGARRETVSRWARGIISPTPAAAVAIRGLLDKHKLRKLAA